MKQNVINFVRLALSEDRIFHAVFGSKSDATADGKTYRNVYTYTVSVK